MKRLILTEDEKNRILGLHGSNLILEQGNPKVSQIQTYLIGTKKYDLGKSGPNKDGVDGVWGKKTRDAVKAEFGIDIDETGNVSQPTSVPGSTEQPPAGSTPAGSTPAGSTPAGTTPAGTQQPKGVETNGVVSFG